MGSDCALKQPCRDTLWLLVCVCTLTHATAVLAHTTSTGLATLTVTGSMLTYRLTLVLSELPDAPAQLFTAAVTGDASSVEPVAVLLRQSVQVRADDHLCRAGRATLQSSRLGEARVTLALTLHCPVPPAQLVIHDDWCDVQTPPTPALRLCIIKSTGFLGLLRECNPCFSGRYRFFPLKKANLLNDALVERRSWRGLRRVGRALSHAGPH